MLIWGRRNYLGSEIICIFKPKNKNSLPNFDRGLQMDTNVLKYNYKENTKYLGVILDRNLTFETHTKELNQKLVKYTGLFSKARHFLPVNCRKIIYNAFISSRLNCGSEIYVKTNKRHIQPLAHTTLSGNTEQIIKNPVI